MQSPPIWQRLLAAAAYLLPWSDGLSFGRSLFGLFPVLQWLSLPALPVALLQQAVPFGSFLLFLVLFLAVWWVWIYTCWITNWLDPERPAVRWL